MPPKEMGKEDRRNEILMAAIEAFAEKGYDGTSMDEIVKRTGLSKGTLYWHFKNKHDLLLAVIDSAMNGMIELTKHIAAQDLPASDRLRAIFQESIEAFVEDDSMITLMANFFFLSTQSEHAQEIMREGYRVFTTEIERVIQEGIDSGEFRPVDAHMTAIMLMGAGDGIAFQSLLKPDWDLVEVLDVFLNVALRGLQKEQ
ncbi:MAG: TetR/AcrR family transcriptional regulator [Chloroflexi bacterium]|nr:TetR/AcrR family transcriptional regulator [Chloroflexota bacterium]